MGLFKGVQDGGVTDVKAKLLGIGATCVAGMVTVSGCGPRPVGASASSQEPPAARSVEFRTKQGGLEFALTSVNVTGTISLSGERSVSGGQPWSTVLRFVISDPSRALLFSSDQDIAEFVVRAADAGGQTVAVSRERTSSGPAGRGTVAFPLPSDGSYQDRNVGGAEFEFESRYLVFGCGSGGDLVACSNEER